jgi:hypothetical protein
MRKRTVFGTCPGSSSRPPPPLPMTLPPYALAMLVPRKRKSAASRSEAADASSRVVARGRCSSIGVGLPHAVEKVCWCSCTAVAKSRLCARRAEPMSGWDTTASFTCSNWCWNWGIFRAKLLGAWLLGAWVRALAPPSKYHAHIGLTQAPHWTTLRPLSIGRRLILLAAQIPPTFDERAWSEGSKSRNARDVELARRSRQWARRSRQDGERKAPGPQAP